MSKTLSFLQPEMVVTYDGRAHRVVLVNDCRAKIVPVAKLVRTVRPRTGKHAGKVIRFNAPEVGHNISPNSELEAAA